MRMRVSSWDQTDGGREQLGEDTHRLRGCGVRVLILYQVLRLFVEVDPVDPLTHRVDVRGERRLGGVPGGRGLHVEAELADQAAVVRAERRRRGAGDREIRRLRLV